MEGGLACPDLQKYFHAALLSHAHNWVFSDESNAAVVLEETYLGSHESLRNALFRGVKAPFPLTHSMKAVIKVWQLLVCKHSEDPYTRFPNTPLWLNPQLSEFLTVPDPWAARGVKKLDPICSNGSLLSFDFLK